VDSPPVQPAKKKNFVSSFAKHLLKNSDGAIASSIPIDPVADGVVAVKNAALTAHDESKTVTPAPARVPAPANLRGVRSGSRGVRLTWVAAGPDYRYNVYAAYADNPNSWDIGNDQPLKGPEITWTAPAKGTQMFELYLKTVDAQGRESAPSNHIVVDLR
jgi:hypothetical protein